MMEDHKLDKIIDHLYGELDQTSEEAFLEEAHNSSELADELTEYRKILTAYRLNPLPEVPANSALNALQAARNPKPAEAEKQEDKSPSESADHINANSPAKTGTETVAAATPENTDTDVEKTIDLSAPAENESTKDSAEAPDETAQQISPAQPETSEPLQDTPESAAHEPDLTDTSVKEKPEAEEATDTLTVSGSTIELPKKFRWHRLTSMAAGIVICVGAYTLLREDSSKHSEQNLFATIGDKLDNTASDTDRKIAVGADKYSSTENVKAKDADTITEEAPRESSLRRQIEEQKRREMRARKPQPMVSVGQRKGPELLITQKDELPLLAKSGKMGKTSRDPSGAIAASKPSSSSLLTKNKVVTGSETPAVKMPQPEVAAATPKPATDAEEIPAIPDIPAVAEVAEVAEAETSVTIDTDGKSLLDNKEIAFAQTIDNLPAPELEERSKLALRAKPAKKGYSALTFSKEGSINTSNSGPFTESMPRESVLKKIGEHTTDEATITQKPADDTASSEGYGTTAQTGPLPGALPKRESTKTAPATLLKDTPTVVKETVEKELITIKDEITQVPTTPRKIRQSGIPEFIQIPGVHEPVAGQTTPLKTDEDEVLIAEIPVEEKTDSAPVKKSGQSTEEIEIVGEIAPHSIELTQNDVIDLSSDEIAQAPATAPNKQAEQLNEIKTPSVHTKLSTPTLAENDVANINENNRTVAVLPSTPQPLAPKLGSGLRANTDALAKTRRSINKSAAETTTSKKLSDEANKITVSDTDSAEELYKKGKILYDAGHVMTALFALEEAIYKGLPEKQLVNALSLKARLEMKLRRFVDMGQTIKQLRPHSKVTANALDVLRLSALNRSRMQIEAENSAARFNTESRSTSRTQRTVQPAPQADKAQSRKGFNPTTDPYYKD